MGTKFDAQLNTASRAIVTGSDGLITDTIGVVPTWVKYTVAETAFTAAATTETIELFSLAAGGIIHAVKQKHSASFTGGSISAFTTSVGITGTLEKYAANFDVFQATGDTVQQITGTLGTEDHGSATSIKITAISTSDNVVNATAGSVDVWVLQSIAV